MPTGIIIINKPQGWTSHDVVAKLRGIFKEKRVGHAGTLDPMATGVLPVFVGRATRAAEFMESAGKSYRAGLRLGLETDTQDTTGTILKTSPVEVTRERLEAVMEGFTGKIEQIPPMYSAIKVGGQKLYQIARKGGTVERKPRPVEIFRLKLLEGQGADWLFDVDCSKGLYVRTLCADIGAALGCGGAMSSLVRTRAGAYDLTMAHTIDQVAELADQGRQESLLLPVDSMFSCPSVVISSGKERRCRNGNSFATAEADGTYRVYSQSGEFLMLGQAQAGQMKTIKSFFEV